ncbi:methylated-DNA--[protein]-cysteine S-methyltransferase [Achromobacter pestifer]
MNLFLSQLESPMGTMLLVTDAEDVVRALEFSDHKARMRRRLREQYGEVQLADARAPIEIANAFACYLGGDLHALDGLQTKTMGSELQHKVWEALRGIPVGTTTTYGRLARDLGFTDRRAAIDIGAANGANPIAIIVPCHRVIASNGDLKGYAWGLHRKRWLLEHEKVSGIKGNEPESQTAMLPGF